MSTHSPRALLWLHVLAVWASLAPTVLAADTGQGDVDEDTIYKQLTRMKLEDNATFEYIVVGAGAGGCAAAARLAARGHHVLLLEAGGLPGALSKIPAAAMAQLGSATDWQYPTLANNVSCLSQRECACRFSRGKVLGGSTAINYMLATRGVPEDFQYELPGWSWPELQPYFLRSEGLQRGVLERLPRSSLSYHNTTGPVKQEYFDDPQNPWHARILRGYEELKFPSNFDVNGASEVGITQVYGYVYEGERMSAARAYLTLDVGDNLQVATHTLCTGVIVEDGSAQGVMVLPAGLLRPLRLFATKEVILSAGTVGTPQILMLSGIGPARHLNEMGIPVQANLPVGENMSDHVLPLLFVLVDRGKQPFKDLAKLLGQVGDVAQFIFQQEGPLASNGLSDATAFANTCCYDGRTRRLRDSDAACQRPSLQVIHAYIGRNIIPLGRLIVQQATNLDDAVIDQLVDANTDNALIVVSPIVLTPYSRGSIRLATTDPNDFPAIFPNYLGDKRDVDEMLRSIRIIEDLMETPTFRAQNASLLRLRFAGCPTYRRRRAAYWRCYARHMTYAVFHACGTCALGRVLDARLRVRGVRRLRVADLSAAPRLPRANTAALALALGERVVDIIAEDSQDG